MGCSGRAHDHRHPQPRPDGAPSTSPRARRAGRARLRGARPRLRAGLLVRVTGDTIALSPPLTISEAEIADLARILGDVLESLE